MRTTSTAVRCLAGPVLMAIGLAGCAATPTWTNADPQANVKADSQKCHNTMTTPTATNSAACDRNPTATGCNAVGPVLPQDDAWMQTSEYETCMGKLGWHR